MQSIPRPVRLRAPLFLVVLSSMVLLLAGRAHAERPHAVYVEALGKSGLYGVGYDWQANRRWGLGLAASFTVVDGERITSVSPYVAARLAGGRRHGWFAHLGPQLVHVAIPSPVPEWDGTSRSGVGVELSSGWEYRDQLLLRVYAMAAAGKGGVAPWIGVSIGWTL